MKTPDYRIRRAGAQVPRRPWTAERGLVVSVAPLRLLLAPCLATKSIRNFFALLAGQDTSLTLVMRKS